ncbi:MAG: glycogen debranching enzyme [Blautia sp.]|nr:glycogen debranching enzyme [Blautia sp.]
MKKVDQFPTNELNGIAYVAGRPMPFGAELLDDDTVNFAIYSKEAVSCELLLYHLGEEEPFFDLQIPQEFRRGSVYAVMVFGLDWENVEYGYRFDGPTDESKGYRFNRNQVVLDPYAKLVSGRDIWREKTYPDSAFQHRGRIIREDFDWDGDAPLETPLSDLVIYEMHIRGFTNDESSGVKHKGTFAGVIEKIPYLKKLGVNCLELMPVFEFEEFIYRMPDTCCNYWGYVTYNYFSPKAGYAALGKFGQAVDEFKNMVKQLHKNGIEVILDIVFNHTAEGTDGDAISFRGVDNRTYYIMNDDGTYANYSACGNTVNCNNPVVRSFIIDSLRYWVSSYHIDGFRIDEAPIFARGQDGKPMVSPPLVDSLANDPILSNTKFISEGWDPEGFSTIGRFPKGWADWNPRMRDTVKRFVKGSGKDAPVLYTSIEGSPDMFPYGGADSSVNYITSHDGFTLYDSVSYNQTRNETNVFTSPMDHDFDNCSWNCGVEGETDQAEVNALRRRQMKNMTGILMLSRGIPMFWAGDEFANTQYGNNNAFSQDSKTSWLDWNRLKEFEDVFEFNRLMIQFRKEHPVIRRPDFYNGCNSSGYPEMSWHGEKAWKLDRSKAALVFGFMYSEPAKDFHTKEDAFIYCGVNAHWEAHTLELPIIPEGMNWRIVTYTGDPENSCRGEIKRDSVTLMPRSLIVLLGSCSGGAE